MKAIIKHNVEVRAEKKNIALSLKASEKPQSLPQWAVEQAVEKGAAEIVARNTPARRRPKKSPVEPDAASSTTTENEEQ